MAKKVSVRLMVPFSMQCGACKGYIYKSTKFNARKTSTKETYLGVPIIQFEFRCSSCSAPITFRTAPESRGYKIVAGATELERAAPTQESGRPAPSPGRPPERASLDRVPAKVHKLPRPKPRKHLL